MAIASFKADPPPLPPRGRSCFPPSYSVLPNGTVGVADNTITLVDRTDALRLGPPALPSRQEPMLPAMTGDGLKQTSMVSAERDRSTSPGSMTDGSNEVPRPRKGTIHLTPYTTHHKRSDSVSSHTVQAHNFEDGTDPRTSSMQSLLPVDSMSGLRRTLLLVYVHGFVGNDMSFGSFPAHVHNLLTSYLARSHVVHTKIYPRYKSRKNISHARDDFSKWLYPHENPSTDIVLIGHSLGGILTAEVVLLPSGMPKSHESFQHHILGTISFDTPFLGIHPSVVGTGIASLFQSTSKTPDTPKSSESGTEGDLSQAWTEEITANANLSEAMSPSASIMSDPFAVPSNDPYFNPAFPNDVILPQRVGKLENFMYFWSKHCGDMKNAISSYVTSHLEFGGCLADYPGLHKRYSAIRGLEDLDPATQPMDPQGRKIPRVRFANYYSASTGRVKIQPRSASKSPQRAQEGNSQRKSRSPSRNLARNSGFRTPSFRSARSVRSATSLRSAERPWDDELTTKAGDTPPEPMTESSSDPNHNLPVRPRPVSSDRGISSEEEMTQLEPEEHFGYEEHPSTEGASRIDPNEFPYTLPLAEPPKKPEEKDYTVKEFFKASLTAYAQELKKYDAEKRRYEKAYKAQEKINKANRKATEKATIKQAKERARAEKERVKAEVKALKLERQQQITHEKHELKRRSTVNQMAYDQALQQDADEQGVTIDKVQNKKRDRKFCALPTKDPNTGQRDATWVRVYMEGVNEIEAHTTMFVMSETYAKLVGDTAERIESWLKDAGLAGKEQRDCKT